jgi:hypothetical protein
VAYDKMLCTLPLFQDVVWEPLLTSDAILFGVEVIDLINLLQDCPFQKRTGLISRSSRRMQADNSTMHASGPTLVRPRDRFRSAWS